MSSNNSNNSLKKPPTPSAASKNGGGGAASNMAMKKPPPASASAAADTSSKKRGVDALLTSAGKQLRAGECITVRLIKGPSTTKTADPVDSKAPMEAFPLLAKFPESSVVRPDFTKHPWCEARLYQQDKPKPLEDSDEEDKDEQQVPKKRWKYNRKREQVPDRQWILQEQVDFLETMVARREKRSTSSDNNAGAGGTNNNNNCGISSRYEGLPENNNSHYVLLRLAPPPNSSYYPNIKNNNHHHHDDENDNDEEEDDDDGVTRLAQALWVQPLPRPNCTITFAQPAARKTYSLNQAEQAITDQRMGIVRTMHHNNPSNMMMTMNGGGSSNKDESSSGGGAGGGTAGGGGADASLSSDQQQQQQPIRPLIIPKKKNTSRNRLLNKLKKSSATNEEEEEEGDDVMGDITFRNRKGTSSAARRELLQMSESHVTVSNEGVLGGSNDAAFGGRQRFANVLAEKDSAAAGGAGKKSAGGGDDDEGGKPAERGADGAAMEEDFYQRDVQAEYEELDFDANEQFDDDDVDLGEGEVVVDPSGFGGNDDDAEDLDEDSDDLEGEDETLSGAEGLASLAGFKAMLARARGEAPLLPVDGGVDPAGGGATADSKKDEMAKKRAAFEAEKAKRRQANDHMAKILARTTGTNPSHEHHNNSANGQAFGDDNNPTNNAVEAAVPPVSKTELANQTDANGQRIISLDAVRREIWLENGSIPMKRLMKIFDVKKKASKERRDRFMEVVKELCTMTTDPLAGRMLVLKQHYSK